MFSEIEPPIEVSGVHDAAPSGWSQLDVCGLVDGPRNPQALVDRSIAKETQKGAVASFAELYQSQWPEETMALMGSIGIGPLRIERFDFNPQKHLLSLSI